MVTPTGVTSCPSRPVVLMSPPADCALRSAPSRAASVPRCHRSSPRRTRRADCGRRRRRTRVPRVHRPRREVRDHDVGPLREAKEHLAPVGRAQISGHAALPAIAADEVRAAGIARLHRQPPRLVAETGQLDLDHVGAHSASVAAACGPCTSSPASITFTPSSAPMRAF